GDQRGEGRGPALPGRPALMTPVPIQPLHPVIGSAHIQPLVPVQDPAIAAPPAAPATGPGSFQSLLADQIGSVVDMQNQADAASQAVASGQSSDLAGAVVAVEKASIALELTGAIRNKAVDAYQEIMRMQV